MIPVFQTKFHSETISGNCLAAAVASILEIPINLVPQFEESFSDHPAKWRLALTRFIAGHGYVVEEFDEDPLLNTPYLATGRSPRSNPDAEFNHIVVFQSGNLLHDPHPSGDGIIDPCFFANYKAIDWANLADDDIQRLINIQNN